ncbi:hypothetical protein [Burkholderia glumae]|uniref:hypothetical protein n=1 Tax=Burkholderia glumae TaxID=337 RepID=UPI003B9A48BE
MTNKLSDDERARIRAEAIEKCAKVCEDYAADQWSLYKGRAPYTGKEAGRADPDVQSRSNGADVCAMRLRTLAASPAPATPTVDREAIIEQCAALADSMAAQGYPANVIGRDIRALKAAPAISESEDARDAARYRWLRSQTNCMHGYHFEFPKIDTIVKHSPNTYAARFDAAIDAARKENQT